MVSDEAIHAEEEDLIWQYESGEITEEQFRRYMADLREEVRELQERELGFWALGDGNGEIF
jgi:hypothetical protein